jgi:hypothetical protein
MSPLKIWSIAFLSSAYFGIFWFEVIAGLWLAVVGIGVAAGLGALALAPHYKN